MSGSISSKFQDHYTILGVEPNADSETIQTAYSKLAQKYHPNNADTGDEKKFESVNQAYEVLADPALRASFDKVKGVDIETGAPKFSGSDFFRALGHGAVLRSAVLCILYDRMRIKSFKPSLPMRHLEGMLSVTPEDLNFALWYLKKRAFVFNDDKSSLSITVEGMDFLEQNRPSEDGVLSFIKQDSIASSSPKPLAAQPKTSEPVLNALSRALQRNTTLEETTAPFPRK